MFIPFALKLLHVPLLVIPQLMASRFGTPRFNVSDHYGVRSPHLSQI